MRARITTSKDEMERELPPFDEESEFEFSEPGEHSDDDAVAVAQNMSRDQQEALDRSRKRGPAPVHTDTRARRTAEQQIDRVREPARDREFVWRPINTLDAPPPRSGMEQRWIRYLIGPNSDPQNWSKQARQQWSPRKVDTVPGNYAPPVSQIAGIGEVISVGDLILCERPAYIGQARRKYMADKLRRQVAASRRSVQKVERADHPITVEDPSERATVGIGRRRAKVQEDE